MTRVRWLVLMAWVLGVLLAHLAFGPGLELP